MIFIIARNFRCERLNSAVRIFLSIITYCSFKRLWIAFHNFLEEVSRRQADRFTLLFLDQAGWHTANSLDIPPNIRLAHIPAYSPELNPTEHIWDELREKHFHNNTFGSISAVEGALEIGLRNLEKDMQRVQSMTGFEWIITIE